MFTTKPPDPDILRAGFHQMSEAKLNQLWTARPSQLQVLSNMLHNIKIGRLTRMQIKNGMRDRPMRDLPQVIIEAIKTTESWHDLNLSTQPQETKEPQ